MKKYYVAICWILISCSQESDSETWIKTIGNSSLTETTAQAIDTEGNIVIGGTYVGENTEFEGETLPLNGSMNSFLFKINSFGEKIWSLKLGESGLVSISDIDTDQKGNIYALIRLSKSPRYGDEGVILLNNTVIRGNGDTPLIAKITASGKIEWIRELSNFNQANFNVVKLWNDNIYVGGGVDRINKMLSKISGSPPNYLSGKAIFLKLNLNGEVVKDYILNGNYFGEITDIEIIDSEALYVSGNVNCSVEITNTTKQDNCIGNVRLNNEEFVFNTSSSGFIARIDNDEYSSFKLIGNSKQGSTIESIAIDKDHNLYIAGGYREKLVLDEMLLSSEKNESGLYKENSFYVAKLDSNFKYMWGMTTKGGSGSDYIFDMSIHKNSELVVVGDFFEQVKFGDFLLGEKQNNAVGKRSMFIALVDVTNGNYRRVFTDNSEYGSKGVNLNTSKDDFLILSGTVKGKSRLNEMNFGFNKGTNVFVSKISLLGN